MAKDRLELVEVSPRDGLQNEPDIVSTENKLALIDHILARYHEVHRQQLPELIRMARRVEAVHRDHPQVPRGLADHLEAMAQELDSHMRKEEMVLFPLIARGQGSLVASLYGSDEIGRAHV